MLWYDNILVICSLYSPIMGKTRSKDKRHPNDIFWTSKRRPKDVHKMSKRHSQRRLNDIQKTFTKTSKRHPKDIHKDVQMTSKRHPSLADSLCTSLDTLDVNNTKR